MARQALLRCTLADTTGLQIGAATAHEIAANTRTAVTTNLSVTA